MAQGTKRRFLLFTHFSLLLSRSWSQRQQDKLICHSSPQQLPPAPEDLKLSLQAILESVVPAGGLGSIPPSPHSQPWLEHLQGKVPRGAALCQCEEATAPHPSESESGRQDGAQEAWYRPVISYCCCLIMCTTLTHVHVCAVG